MRVASAAGVVMGLILWLASHVIAQAVSAADVEVFETSVRPVLIEQCSECHGAEEQWSGLRVDSREALLTGGDRGPAIVPGKPDESLLIKAVRQTGSLQMPDGGKLADDQIAALERWVQRGAVWPEATISERPDREQAQRDHWAFQPIARPKPSANAVGRRRRRRPHLGDTRANRRARQHADPLYQ